MEIPISIEKFKTLDHPAIQHLIETSVAESFHFLLRFKREWQQNTNRFDQTGEGYYQIRLGDQIIGLGGISNNPYKELGKVGRVRRLYIHPAYRRRGIAKQFIFFLAKEYQQYYHTFRLRTDSEAACRFYEALGFSLVAGAQKSTYEVLITDLLSY